MTVDMPCDCKHPKSEHAGLAYACWGCDCPRYTPDIQVGASLFKDLAKLEASVPAVGQAAARLDEATAAIVKKARNAESTSARLRRVEQERDMAISRTAVLMGQLWAADRRGDALEAELASARAELQQLRAQLAERGAP